MPWGNRPPAQIDMSIDYGTNLHLAGYGQYAPWRRYLSYGTISASYPGVNLFRPCTIPKPARVVYWGDTQRGYPHFIFAGVNNWDYNMSTNTYGQKTCRRIRAKVMLLLSTATSRQSAKIPANRKSSRIATTGAPLPVLIRIECAFQ